VPLEERIPTRTWDQQDRGLCVAGCLRPRVGSGTCIMYGTSIFELPWGRELLSWFVA